MPFLTALFIIPITSWSMERFQYLNTMDWWDLHESCRSREPYRYVFFHLFLPEEVMEQIIEILLPLCLEADEEEDCTIIEDQLEGKSFK